MANDPEEPADLIDEDLEEPEEETAESTKAKPKSPEPEGPMAVDGGEGIGRLPLPRKDRGEIYAVANQLLGAARIRVMCEDALPRMGRITGKLKKKMWIREGDLLIVRPWGFQEGKADILFRYSRTQATYLSRRSLLPPSVDLFQGEFVPEPPNPRRRH